MLYNRDYTVLTEQEEKKWIKVKTWRDNIIAKKSVLSLRQLFKYWRDKPRAVDFYESLFPNNFIHPDLYDDTERVKAQLDEFTELLDKKVSERAITNYISSNQAYFLIDTIFDEFYTGHHEAYIFKEFQLPPNYVADYLLVGKNSGGYEFVFVEMENAFGEITLASGEFGTTIRKGIKQIEDWDSWVEANFSYLRLLFERTKNKTGSLPKEFVELDKTRIHNVVVAGRREHFTEKTYRLKRKAKRQSNVLVLHYDNLIDIANLHLSSKIKSKSSSKSLPLTEESENTLP